MSESSKSNQPTILLGAGAVIEIDAPSTTIITQQIIKPNQYENYIAKDVFLRKTYFSVITRIYKHLKERYPIEPNFEHIFHVMEMLESYSWVWFGNSKNTEMFPVFAPFVVPKTNIVPLNEWGNLSSLIDQCRIDIMGMINKYDELYRKRKDDEYLWYNCFWNKFNGFDLFNLNYDTTIEQSLQNYCDGFVASDDSRFQKFDPKTLFDDENRYKICHLHGCILYYHQRYIDNNYDVYEYKHHDMYKWSDFEKVKGLLQGSFGSNPSNQSGEMLHVGSIITGLRKTDKVTVMPYNYYHHYLNKAILNNRSLLIVGYSFGDLYINDLIERMNLLYGKEKRIVIITRWQYDEIDEGDGTVSRTFREKESNITNMNHYEYAFIQRMMHEDDFIRLLDKTIQEEGSYTSINGDVKLFVYGFKSAVEKHGAEIVEFLTN